jgi:hypothetical protein
MKKKQAPRNPIALAMALRHPSAKKMRDRRERRPKDRCRKFAEEY